MGWTQPLPIAAAKGRKGRHRHGGEGGGGTEVLVPLTMRLADRLCTLVEMGEGGGGISSGSVSIVRGGIKVKEEDTPRPAVS